MIISQTVPGVPFLKASCPLTVYELSVCSAVHHFQLSVQARKLVRFDGACMTTQGSI